jgi:hypothetical protein
MQVGHGIRDFASHVIGYVTNDLGEEYPDLLPSRPASEPPRRRRRRISLLGEEEEEEEDEEDEEDAEDEEGEERDRGGEGQSKFHKRKKTRGDHYVELKVITRAEVR